MLRGSSSSNIVQLEEVVNKKTHQSFSFKSEITREVFLLFFFLNFMTKFSPACLTWDTLCLSSAKYQLKTFALMNTRDDSLWNLKNTAHVRAIRQKQENKTTTLVPHSLLSSNLRPRCSEILGHSCPRSSPVASRRPPCDMMLNVRL